MVQHTTVREMFLGPLGSSVIRSERNTWVRPKLYHWAPNATISNLTACSHTLSNTNSGYKLYVCQFTVEMSSLGAPYVTKLIQTCKTPINDPVKKVEDIMKQ